MTYHFYCGQEYAQECAHATEYPPVFYLFLASCLTYRCMSLSLLVVKHVAMNGLKLFFFFVI